jgi:hypothetical protein
MKSVGSSTAVHDEVNGLILIEWHSQWYGHVHSCDVHFDGARTDTFFASKVVLWGLLHVFKCFPRSFDNLCLFWTFDLNFLEDLAFFANNVLFEAMVVHLLGANGQKCFGSYISSLGYPGLMCPYEIKHCSTFASMAV